VALALDEHRRYLADKRRLSLYRKAIREVVRPGDVVMDLGAGTGILGLLACEAGARRVYAVDVGGMIQLVREIARANGFGDRVIGIQGMSTRVELPEKVDCIVGDQVGSFGFEAGLFEYFRDAARRFLKPGGHVIPRTVKLHLAAASNPKVWKNLQFWETRPAGFDFSSAIPIALHENYPTDPAALTLVSNQVELLSLDVANAPPTFEAEATLRIIRGGLMHGLVGSFSARLSPRVGMTNNALAAHPIDRACAFLPIERPWRVLKGDLVRATLKATPEQSILTWKVKLFDGKRREKARSIQSSARGMLLSAEALAKSDPTYIPRLSPWGEVRRTIIEACDGRKSLAEIERIVFNRHQNLFDSQEHAARYVAEITSRDAIPADATREGT
jgi:SAM-dependent methyltransferase